jgi:hypothetical protein
MNESYHQHRLPPLPKTQGLGTLGFVTGRKNNLACLGRPPMLKLMGGATLRTAMATL